MEPVRREFRASRRQLECLLWRCATGSRKEAAVALGISRHTIRTHLRLLEVGYGYPDDATACYALSDELRALADVLRATSPSGAAASPPAAAADSGPNGE